MEVEHLLVVGGRRIKKQKVKDSPIKDDILIFNPIGESGPLYSAAVQVQERLVSERGEGSLRRAKG